MRKLLLALSILFFTGSNASANEMTKEEFAKLLVPSTLYAVSNSRYDRPEGTPYIALVEPSVIHQLIGCQKNCFYDVSAYYDNVTQTIYVDERILTISKTKAMGLIIHEMVHFLQFANGEEFRNDCETRAKLEKEALIVQFKFLLGRQEIPNYKHVIFDCGDISTTFAIK